ncbi:MAG TPA: LamG-like jellyroll fold domain-containing protein, partial [Verrucomicrobiae bacterium]|nr:LamG-like jellyroll fold domain-containing protein [Verrucomicrobiae bacterium]
MNSTISRPRLARAASFRLIASSLLFLALPRLLPAQILQHRYSFTSDASDSVGGANGTLVGNATISGGTLLLPGGGNSDNPSGYVQLPNGIVSNDASITVECWVTDTAGSVWAEAWCFGDSAAGPGQPPSGGTAYISLIPHSGEDDFRAAFNLTGGDEIDVIDPAGPMPLNVEHYTVVTYDAASTTATLYLDGAQVAIADIPTNLAPANYGDTFNNWFGRDEFGGDPMFAGSIDELRIWNAAASPLYIAVSAVAGPNVLVTNLTPVSVSVAVASTSMIAGEPQPAMVSANFLQATNVTVTGAASNWISSDTNVLTVSDAGVITGVGSGNATVSAMLGGTTGTSPSITVTGSQSGPIVTVGYWQFDNSADLGIDSSGLGNNLATASGTPTYSSAGKFGGALYLDGNSTMTTLSGAFPLDVPTGANPYTIAVWEKIDTGCPNNGGFIGWGVNNTSEANNFRLNGPNSVDDYWYANDFIVSDLATNPMDGNWHALAVTWDGTNETMYVDGANVGTRTPTSPNVQASGFVVGKTTSDVNFVGWLEDLLIANIALTPADIAIFQAGEWSSSLSTFPLLPTASPSNTVFAGTTVTLSVLVAGTPPYQYQWEEDGTNISWGTDATLVLTNATVANSGSYDVIVGNTNGTNTSPVLTVTINPASAPVFGEQPSPASSTNYLGGFVTFTAAVSGTQPIQLQWQRNGVNILNATASTLTLASLQAGEAGTYTLFASNSLGVTNSLPAVLTILPPPNPSALNVLTYHNDNARDGANTNEVLLTLANVHVSTFGKLITYPTDGLIIAQPLYVSGLAIPGQGTHNVVFVATENDSVYAFDADSNAGTNGGLLWHDNLGIAVSSYNDEFGNRYQGTYYGDIVPVVGITGTPVIDLASGTLYVNVHTREVGATTNYYHRIHALNITNGAEQSYSPVAVTNSVPGTGVDGTNGVVGFDARTENQRPGMTLAGGMLYGAYGSYADTDPYHGWVLGFKATNLAQSASYAFNTTPNATVATFGVNAGEGALWMSGNGLCVDVSNNLYFATANGSFSANTNGGDYGDSFVKLSTTNGLAVADYFTPYNQATLAVNDTDLGSGGTILLPDSVGSTNHPHLMVGCGKDGILRLVDRDNMGKYNTVNDSQIVQEVPGAITGAWSTPAFFNQHIYYQGSGDVMKAFFISNAVITAAPTSEATINFSALGGTPSISANGTNDAIVWAIQSDGGPDVLHAYNATNLAQELYNSSQNPARDNPGLAIIMTTPTVVNGKVFVGAQYSLSIYGNSLFLATPVIAPAGGLFTNSVIVTMSDASPNSTIYYTLDGTAPNTNSLLYTGPFVLTTSANVQAIAAQPGAANSGVASVGFVDSSAIGSGIGLQGSYWANVTSIAFTNSSFSIQPTLVRTDPTIDFNWATAPPAASIGLSNFVVRWIGSVQPEYSETYTFSTDTDSGVRLYVNGQLLINKWVTQPATTWSNTITLAAQQRYNIQMDFFNQTGGAAAQLYWSSPSTANAIIPQTQLYPYTNPPPAVVLTAPGNGSSYTASASV